MSDDSGRNSREETTGSTGDKKSTPLCDSGTTSCGKERKIPQPETLTHSDTSNYRSRSGSVQTTTNGRLGNTFFGCSRFHLCKRVVHTSHITESRVSPSAHSCSAAQLVAEQVMVLDTDSVGSEESFTMLNVSVEPAVTQQEQQFLLEQLRHLLSSGITGQEARRAIVRMFPEKQQKIKVSKAVRTLQDTMQKI